MKIDCKILEEQYEGFEIEVEREMEEINKKRIRDKKLEPNAEEESEPELTENQKKLNAL